MALAAEAPAEDWARLDGKCEACRFYKPDDEGECRRFPPPVVMVDSTGAFSLVFIHR